MFANAIGPGFRPQSRGEPVKPISSPIELWGIRWEVLRLYHSPVVAVRKLESLWQRIHRAGPEQTFRDERELLGLQSQPSPWGATLPMALEVPVK